MYNNKTRYSKSILGLACASVSATGPAQTQPAKEELALSVDGTAGDDTSKTFRHRHMYLWA